MQVSPKARNSRDLNDDNNYFQGHDERNESFKRNTIGGYNNRGSLNSSEFDSIMNGIRSKIADAIGSSRDYSSGVEFLQDAFKYGDNNNNSSKSVTQAEFNRVMKDAGIRVTRMEVSSIYEYLDPDFVGFIGIDSFIRKLYPTNNNNMSRDRDFRSSNDDINNNNSSSSSASNIPSVQEMRAIFRNRVDLKDILVSQFRTVDNKIGKNIQDFQNILKKSDRYNRGKLERDQFAQCLSKFGVNLRVAQERDLVDSLAEDGGRGEINYEAFIAVMSSELQSNISDALDSLKLRMSKEFRGNYDPLSQMFERMDRRRESIIGIDDFEDSLKKFNISLNRIEAKNIVSSYSKDGHAVNYRDFLKYLQK